MVRSIVSRARIDSDCGSEKSSPVSSRPTTGPPNAPAANTTTTEAASTAQRRRSSTRASASSTTPSSGIGGPSHQLAAHSLLSAIAAEVQRLRDVEQHPLREEVPDRRRVGARELGHLRHEPLERAAHVRLDLRGPRSPRSPASASARRGGRGAARRRTRAPSPSAARPPAPRRRRGGRPRRPCRRRGPRTRGRAPSWCGTGGTGRAGRCRPRCAIASVEVPCRPPIAKWRRATARISSRRSSADLRTRGSVAMRRRLVTTYKYVKAALPATPRPRPPRPGAGSAARAWPP